MLGQRQDGYHELQTLFQLLDWGDDIRIRPTRDQRISRLPVTYGVAQDEDLVIKAAKLLQKEAGCRRGAEIAVVKRIPPGSGLGGGSSDAATVLRVLNHLWGCGLEIRELAAIGRNLGADVPVFIHGCSAMATGIGELLEPVDLGLRHYVLVFPSYPVSTREVFSDPLLVRNSKPISLAAALAGEGRNDCEPVVRKRFPAFDRTLKELDKWGRPIMTGTGSGIFISMPDKNSAKSAAKEIKSLYNARAVYGVNRSPLEERLASR